MHVSNKRVTSNDRILFIIYDSTNYYIYSNKLHFYLNLFTKVEKDVIKGIKILNY